MATIRDKGPYQWHVQVRRKGYPIQTRTFRYKAEAEKWARDVESEMDRGIYIDRSAAEQTTFYDVLIRYRDEVVPEHRGAEVEKIRIDALVKDRDLVSVKMAALTSRLIAEWRDRRLKSGVKGSTVNRELNIISAAINTARKEWGVHLDNPVALIRRPQNGAARDRRLNDGEENILLAALEVSPRKNGPLAGMQNVYIRPLVLLALETAMRRGEMLSLLWANIDSKRSLAYLPTTKNGDARTVPLSSLALSVLREMPRSIDGRVFPISDDAVKKAFVRACKRAGIEDLHFHDLRHEATSRLAERLPNLVELAAVTGHKDLRMLKRYYHPRAEDLARKLG